MQAGTVPPRWERSCFNAPTLSSPIVSRPDNNPSAYLGSWSFPTIGITKLELGNEKNPLLLLASEKKAMTQILQEIWQELSSIGPAALRDMLERIKSILMPRLMPTA